MGIKEQGIRMCELSMAKYDKCSMPKQVLTELFAMRVLTECLL